jgi:hypothetical protein
LITHPVSIRLERPGWSDWFPGRLRPGAELASTLAAWAGNVSGWYLVPLCVTVNAPPKAGTPRFGAAWALAAGLRAAPSPGAEEPEDEVDGEDWVTT